MKRREGEREKRGRSPVHRFTDSPIHFQKGFTFLELLVVLTITVLLGATLSAILKTSMDAWQRGEAAIQRCQPARIALQRMSQELRSAVLLSISNNPGKEDGIKFYGRDSYNSYGDRLDFISLSNPNLEGGADPKCDFAEIGYYIYHSETTGLDHLICRWQVSDVPDTDVTDGGLDYTPAAIASHVKKLNFSYWDNATSPPWETSWNSKTKNKLPGKVWIELTVQDDIARVEKEEVFSTIVYLPSS